MIEVSHILVYCVSLLNLASAIRIQSVSEAREEALARQIRQSSETTNTAPSRDKGPGVFGNNSFIFDTPCLRMETKGVNIQIKMSEAVNWAVDEDLTNASYAVSGGNDCTSNASTTDLTVTFSDFPEKSDITQAEFMMIFTRDTFSWWISNFTLKASYKGNSSAGTVNFDDSLYTQDIGAGIGFAYMCQDQYIFISGYQPGETQGGLLFDDLIMQPYIEVTNGSYGPLEPCEYAFTIPLWMSIVTGLIMSLILALGISMLASIRTPDRFDDPKTSKLLSVPNE